MGRLGKLGFLVTALLLLCHIGSTQVAILRNEYLQLTFQLVQGADFRLTDLRQPNSDINLLVPHTSPSFLWSVFVVNEIANTTIFSSNCSAQAVYVIQQPDYLDLRWDTVSALETTVNITVSVSLPSNATTAQFGFSIANNNPQARVGLWDYTIQIPALPCGTDEYLFFPDGFGVEYVAANESIDVTTSAVYPSSTASMQFMAAGGGPQTRGLGVYVGIHDPKATTKTLYVTLYPQFNPTDASAESSSSSQSGSGVNTAQMHSPPQFSHAKSPREGNTSSTLPPSSTKRTPVEDIPFNYSVALGFTYLMENAGERWLTYTQPFSLAVGITTTTPLWWSASQIYREWVMSSSVPWLQAGPVATRDDIPDWLITNNLWFNTGWQCRDIFNKSEGNPYEVLERATAIRSVLNMSFALHWYEWQQGPSPLPEDRYLFDTHYPDYFPPRVGFEATIRQLQEQGIRVLPYINGREFDINSTSYLEEDGGRFCTQYPVNHVFFDEATANLTYNNESFGTNVTFHPADPTTDYWQAKISRLVSELTNFFHADGVYIDQLTSSAPSPDWSPHRDHPRGGGSWWVEGVNALIDKAKAAAPKQTPIISENNAEPYISSINGFLTINPFSQSFAMNEAGMFVPAFSAVYGGYYIGLGSVFNLGDVNQPDVAAARLAAQFVYGIQLGWFSFVGVGVGQYTDFRCGDLGYYDFLLSGSNDTVLFVDFLESLVTYRSVVQPYFIGGRIMKPVFLFPPPYHYYAADLDTLNIGPFPSISSAVWKLDDAMIAIFISSVLAPQLVSFTIDMVDYGYPANATFFVNYVDSDGSRRLYRSVAEQKFTIDHFLQPRSVLIFEITADS